MNYLKVYCNLIKNAENRTQPEGYTEKHHTFPVSIYGKNNRIVVLTAREHYIAHILLEKICIKRYGLYHYKTHKMNKAHCMMKSDKKSRYYNSYLFENARTRRSLQSCGEGNSMWGKKFSDETKKQWSNIRKGKIWKPTKLNAFIVIYLRELYDKQIEIDGVGQKMKNGKYMSYTQAFSIKYAEVYDTSKENIRRIVERKTWTNV
jgi:hypothetical protein